MPPAVPLPRQTMRRGMCVQVTAPAPGRLPAGRRLLCRLAGADIGPRPPCADISWSLPRPCS
eukprot:2451709-Alexandrium_andersonii.AAC.1